MGSNSFFSHSKHQNSQKWLLEWNLHQETFQKGLFKRILVKKPSKGAFSDKTCHSYTQNGLFYQNISRKFSKSALWTPKRDFLNKILEKHCQKRLSQPNYLRKLLKTTFKCVLEQILQTNSWKRLFFSQNSSRKLLKRAKRQKMFKKTVKKDCS